MSHLYRCACGQALYFRNSQCVVCGRTLGYVPEQRELLALEAATPPEGAAVPPDGAWRLARDEASAEGLWLRCANAHTAAACNWLVPQREGASLFCLSCRLNQTVPEASDPQRARNWAEVEAAKRRLVASLLEFGLPVQPRDESPQQGLAFDLLATLPGTHAPMTGHQNGLVTINVDEADDVTRESVRQRMGEPYRTILGHVRHEVGHYYWNRLVQGTDWQPRFRDLFGDESVDYGESLERHYAQGPAPDWPTRFISAYASAHPWEDWAETWAHYMHMIDGLDTAASFDLNLGSSAIEPVGGPAGTAQQTPAAPPVAPPVAPGDVPAPAPQAVAPPAAQAPGAEPAPAPAEALPQAAPPPGRSTRAREAFDPLFEDWLRLTQAMNQLARSLGERDFYPFVVSEPARLKLAFVHEVIGAAATSG